jgi:hypothetical protein
VVALLLLLTFADIERQFWMFSKNKENIIVIANAKGSLFIHAILQNKLILRFTDNDYNSI